MAIIVKHRQTAVLPRTDIDNNNGGGTFITLGRYLTAQGL